MTPPSENASFLGIDLGGSSVKAVTVSAAGQISARVNVDFDAEQHLDWARKIRSIADDLQQDAPATALGLSAPGLAARDQRSIAYMPGRLQGLEGLNWTEFLAAPRSVPVLNDAHAALLGESWLGAAAGYTNVIMLTLGTGVGGAAMVDGRLLRGHLGRAGHMGHVCLDPEGPLDIIHTPGSLELMIGNCSIAERSDGRFISTHALIAAYRAGDRQAQKIWSKSIQALASAVTSLINVLDPEAVIIGGGIARAGDVLFAPLERYLDRIEWRPGGARVRILPARLGEYAGALGAANAARQACEQFVNKPD